MNERVRKRKLRDYHHLFKEGESKFPVPKAPFPKVNLYRKAENECRKERSKCKTELKK